MCAENNISRFLFEFYYANLSLVVMKLLFVIFVSITFTLQMGELKLCNEMFIGELCSDAVLDYHRSIGQLRASRMCT